MSPRAKKNAEEIGQILGPKDAMEPDVLEAMRVVMKALGPLDSAQRSRVVKASAVLLSIDMRAGD